MRSKFSLLCTLCFGLPLMTAAACMAADLLFFHFTHELSRSDLVEVAGIVERAAYIRAPKTWSRHKPTDHIDVWLAGREYPFRFSPEWSHFATLPSGTPFRVGLKPADMQSPLKPTFMRPAPSYWPLTVITPNGIWDTGLTRHNQLARQNLQLFPWLSSLFALLAVLMSSRAFADQLVAKSRLKYGPKRTPLKGRLTFRLLKPTSDYRSK